MSDVREFFQCQTDKCGDEFPQLRSIPYDFQLLESDEAAMVANANMAESFEGNQDLFGMTGQKLVRLVDQVRELLKGKNEKSELPAKIATYLKEKVKWSSALRQPSAETVGQLLNISSMMKKSKIVTQTSGLAALKWGRDTFYDQYSKLLILTQKSTSGPEFDFLLGAMALECFWAKEGDPFGKQELMNRGGPLGYWMYVRRLARHFLAQCHFTSASEQEQQLIERAQALMESPFEYSQILESNEDLSWVSALPKPLALIFGIQRQVMSKDFQKQIKGLLGNPPTGGANVQHFLQFETVKSKVAEIEKAYAVYKGLPVEDNKEKDKNTEQKNSSGKGLPVIGTGSSTDPVDDNSEDSMLKLKLDAETRSAKRLEAVVWVLPTPEKSLDNLVQASVLANLQGVMLAFYDPKVAKSLTPYHGHTKFNRAGALVTKQMCCVIFRSV